MVRRRRDPEPVAKAFGDAVRAEREKRGWSLEELDARMDYGKEKQRDGKYVGEVERGFHSPTLTMAKRIADALEVRLADLVANL